MKKSFFNWIKILFISICYVLILPICNSYGAITISGTPALNFGTIMQNADVSSMTLDYSGSIVSYSGIWKPNGTASNDQITYETTSTLGNQYEHAFLYPDNTTISLTIPGCVASISNVASSDSDNTFAVRGGFSLFTCTSLPTSYTVQYGATLTLTGRCEPGSYTGSITVPSEYVSCSAELFSGESCTSPCDSSRITADHTIALTLVIDEPLSVTEVQEMYFGAVLPTNGGTVTLDTQNGLTYTGVTMFDTTIGKSGIFRVSGIGGRHVNITKPSNATISNGSNSMSLSNFVLSSESITLPDTSLDEAMETFSVGATLNVNANQAEGLYTGTYEISVNY